MFVEFRMSLGKGLPESDERYVCGLGVLVAEECFWLIHYSFLDGLVTGFQF